LAGFPTCFGDWKTMFSLGRGNKNQGFGVSPHSFFRVQGFIGLQDWTFGLQDWTFGFQDLTLRFLVFKT